MNINTGNESAGSTRTTGSTHDPRLYETAVTAPKVNGLDGLTDEHLDSYAQEGYLAVENALRADEVEAAKAGLLHLIMGRHPDYTGVMFETSIENPDALSAEERQDAVRKIQYFVDFDERLMNMACHPALTAVLTRILGEPPKLFQDMALIKPPRIGREKPWHQDKAYFDLPLDTPVVGVWMALDEATVANGCMHVLPGGHRAGPIPHFRRRDWQICDTEMMGKPCVAVPLKPGGVLIFDGMLPHGTPTNVSTQRRKALQYHYAGVSATIVSQDERLAVFGGEGRNVTC